MAALGETGCQITQEGLRTPKLGRLKSSHQRGDDRDLQRLCWM
ncbi:MAG TPA: hypothetical protein VGZ22_16235 [Isosphaeraceae bacterium]|nr:hypothetical protein [Isosphaeraceae bacterium]